MKFTKEVINTIKEFIIDNISKHKNDILNFTADHFGITKPAVSRYLKELLNDNIIFKDGSGRFPKYKLKSKSMLFKYIVTKDLAEDAIWRKDIYPLLKDIKNNVLRACEYGFTEMVNNVIDHSESSELKIVLTADYLNVTFSISDNGIGIFNKIQQSLNLENPRHSIIELAKGKFTSDPINHTGEGIFFTSRIFESFIIYSYNLIFTGHENSDWLFEDVLNNDFKGTMVLMRINRKSNVETKSIFEEYTDPDKQPGFHKTIVPVKLMQYEGDSLLSRSQAKRLITRFEKFLEVILDFEGVTDIGQAFADQIFRVFQNENPHVNLKVINSNEQINKMIKYVSK